MAKKSKKSKQKKPVTYIARVAVTMTERSTKSAVRDLVQFGCDKIVGEKMGENICLAAKASIVDEE